MVAFLHFNRAPNPSVKGTANGYKLRESRLSPDGLEKWLNWVVRLPTGELTGYVQATVLQSGASYVAYEFASKYWRNGIGRASVTAMIEELIKAYDVSLLVAVLKTANYRSMGLLQSLGFDPGTIEDAKTFAAEEDESVMVKLVSSGRTSLPRAQHAG